LPGGHLHASGAEPGGVANAGPRDGRLWRLPAERANRRCSERDAPEDVGPHRSDAANEFSLSDADVRRSRLCEQTGGKKHEEQAGQQQISHNLLRTAPP